TMNSLYRIAVKPRKGCFTRRNGLCSRRGVNHVDRVLAKAKAEAEGTRAPQRRTDKFRDHGICRYGRMPYARHQRFVEGHVLFRHSSEWPLKGRVKNVLSKAASDSG